MDGRSPSGTQQDRTLERLRAVRADPTCVLPECPAGEPRPVAKVRARLERMKEKGPSLLDRRDKSIVGAVAMAWDLADEEALPSLADAQVRGERRFYLQLGTVDPMACLGVQNPQDPAAMLLAWSALAKKHGLHFFAGSLLWCSDSPPQVPEAWWQDLGEALDTELREETRDRWGDGSEGDRLLLRFRDGPALALRPHKGHNSHATLVSLYRGPREHKPFSIEVMDADGVEQDVDQETVARYRAGLLDDVDVVQATLSA